MAPVQKLGNVDTKKRTSQKVAFGIFTLLSYLVVVILFLILGFIIIQGRKSNQLGFPDGSAGRRDDCRRYFPGDCRNTLSGIGQQPD